MTEWPIGDVARLAGLTSRTLRHYEQIGLLLPARVASNGYRFYGDAEVSRLYRILSLRALELPLATIQLALEDDRSLEEAIASHLALLEERHERTEQQIATVRRTLHAVTTGKPITIQEIFAAFDHAQHEDEVRERWGDEAWELSAKRRDDMSEQERRADDGRSLDINAALRDAAASGEQAGGQHFQALVGAHYRWVTDAWGGRVPSREGYLGLSELYVADERFAATYGGTRGAEAIREAMRIWVEAHLA